MPLHVFISGTVDKNISAIIRRGVCSDESILINAWENIKSQYAETIGDQEQLLYLSLYKQINKLSITIEQVDILIRTLQRFYVTQFADELNKLLNTSFVFDVTDLNAYKKNLSRCRSRCKSFEVTLELKMAQFEAISNKEKKGQVADRAYYLSIRNTLWQFMGDYVPDTITVYEFADLIKRLNAEIARREKESKK